MPQDHHARPRVLLDRSPLAGPASGRGLGRYVVALEEGLRSFADVETLSLPYRPGRLTEFRALLPRALALRRPADVVITPTAYEATWVRSSPWICSVLDIIPLDLAEYRRSGVKAELFHRLAARADVVLTLSEYSAVRIADRLRVPRDRIVVAPLPVPRGVGRAVATDRLPIGLEPGRFVLAQADLRAPDARKRVSWLSGLAAGIDVPLVVVGDGTESALDGVRGLGRVSDQEWSTLLAFAALFVSTSAYEGQGLPALEAMSCGCPVVAMDNTSVPEVVDDAGVLVAEGKDAPQRLAAACRSLLQDLATRERLHHEGLRRAASFSEESFALRLQEAVSLARAKHA